VRFIKMLGLAAMAALSVIAYVGATTASADVPCLQSGHHASECPAASVYTGNILGLASGALLLENGSTIETCHSQVLGLAGASEGKHVGYKALVDTGALTFTSCSGLCEEAKSTRPVNLLLEALTLDAWVTEDGQGKARAQLFECFFGVVCTYEFTNAKQLLTAESDTIAAKNVPLTLVSGFGCPNNKMTFDATWLLTEDNAGNAPLFAAALP
jgi:hypothetical protein